MDDGGEVESSELGMRRHGKLPKENNTLLRAFMPQGVQVSMTKGARGATV